MLKRVLLLSLGLWLIVAGGLAVHASPCHMQEEMQPAALSMQTDTSGAHDHCDMMAAPAAEKTSGDTPQKAPSSDGICCCPAVLAALPSPALPDSAGLTFSLPTSFPLDVRAPSRTLIPEPPPPKA